jgi:hypothetical protein
VGLRRSALGRPLRVVEYVDEPADAQLSMLLSPTGCEPLRDGAVIDTGDVGDVGLTGSSCALVVRDSGEAANETGSPSGSDSNEAMLIVEMRFTMLGTFGRLGRRAHVSAVMGRAGRSLAALPELLAAAAALLRPEAAAELETLMPSADASVGERRPGCTASWPWPWPLWPEALLCTLDGRLLECRALSLCLRTRGRARAESTELVRTTLGMRTSLGDGTAYDDAALVCADDAETSDILERRAEHSDERLGDVLLLLLPLALVLESDVVDEGRTRLTGRSAGRRGCSAGAEAAAALSGCAMRRRGRETAAAEWQGWRRGCGGERSAWCEVQRGRAAVLRRCGTGYGMARWRGAPENSGRGGAEETTDEERV